MNQRQDVCETGGKRATEDRSVWLAGPENPPDEPKRLDRPERPSLSSGWLGLCGIGDFGLGLKRDWFSLGRDAPYIEEDGDEHVA